MNRYLPCLLAMLLLVAGCKKIDPEPVDNLNGGRIHVIGHAGLGFESTLSPYPSNTLTGIRKLIEGYGAEGVEVDVQLSKDSVLILYHDQTLESLTNCSGSPLLYNWPELQQCRYRTDFHSHILQNEKIVALVEILQRYAGSAYDPFIYLDLKFPDQVVGGDPAATPYTATLMRRVQQLTAQYGQQHRVIATAGILSMLLHLRSLDPSIALYYDHNNFNEALQVARDHQLHGIVIQNESITKEQVKEAHRFGKKVVLFGVIQRGEIVDAVNKHPDAIQTDNINLLQQILSE